jgi:hypothetical protein
MTGPEMLIETDLLGRRDPAAGERHMSKGSPDARQRLEPASEPKA